MTEIATWFNTPIRSMILLFCTLLLLFGFSAHSGLVEEEPFYLGGIQINEPDDSEWVKTLDAAGMNTVSVTVYARQEQWDSEHLWFDPVDTSVVQEIREAKKQGLNVTLILRTLLDWKFPENHFLWHGMIMPKTDEQVKIWFDVYSRYARRWAQIAQQEAVDIFVIGSEMNALSASAPVDSLPVLLEYYLNSQKLERTKRKLLAFSDSLEERHLWVRGRDNYQSLVEYVDAQQAANIAWARQVSWYDTPDSLSRINQRRKLINAEWETLIHEVRGVYGGKLSYAANFDNYLEVDFWQHLDYIGINAYFKLRDDMQFADNGALFDSLRVGWQNVFDEIAAFRIKKQLEGKPVIFTELGYTYRKNSTLEPWNGAGFSIVTRDSTERLLVWEDQPIDLVERSLAVAALYDAHLTYDKRLLQGLLYWKLSTKKYHMVHEPFMLHVSRDSKDPLLEELAKFAR